ncbi:MAG: hypothetical protein A2Y62_15310 [Candidatus Fischerbacteria bacterium RBG_13_37_8]|uniref:PatA-like N-terminal domain-containing protein n=1 Tax=Candidatus Fischerbacteria bacterium RBG_13_37_8 TaxID=1817863 RepID=A0A1F5VKQ7_9BACT|nr:MAG: hypothetical protein A2Y62_15310 [Candidatus Fischerbacteria bacterium RBG_13_37_8]
MIGDLKTMPLEEILQWLGNGKRTGTLRVSNNYITKKIFFREGFVISASSSDPRDYLGQFLLSRNWITETQLVKAIEMQESKKMLLGKILVELKILNEKQVKEALCAKTLETIFSLFIWEEGRFEFDSEELQGYQLIAIEENIDKLILEGIKRKNDWHRFLKTFKSSTAVVQKVTGKALPGSIKDKILVKNLWRQLDGERSIQEIALHLHSSEYEICNYTQIFYDMQLISIVKIKTTKEEEFALPIQMVLALAQKKLQEGRVEEALNIFNYIIKKQPEIDASVIELRDLAERKYIKQIKDTILKPDLVPHLLISLDEASVLNLTPEESFLLTRIDGSWSVKDILCVVPFNESIAIKYLKNLLQRGFIDLSE